jgi:hypothetical protein
MAKAVYVTISLLALNLTGVDRSANAQASPGPTVRLLVPAYFYPAGDGLKAWKRLIDSASLAPVAAIVNPDSGPGKSLDDSYAQLFRIAKGSKIILIGYVTLSYGKRPISAVKADVDSWLQVYPDIRGIFFDEQPSNPEGVAFATECFTYARSRIDDPVLVTNPGTRCAPGYASAKDSPVVCLFEHEQGFDKYELPDWADRLSADRFAVLLYRVADAELMRQSLRAAIRKRSGYVYITDAKGPMPWYRLPSYWDDEIAAVRQANGVAAPERTR